MSNGNDGSDYTLLSISKEGQIPQCRMRDAAHTQDFARRLRDQDMKRSRKRALVDGLVGGNPPYKNSSLRKAGMGGNCNVNWGTSRMYLESGSGAFYDLFSEAPGTVAIETSHGANEDERLYYCNVMSEMADLMFMEDETWDFEMQQSQDQMVLHGRGPLMFEDAHKVLPRSVHDGELFTPERTKADTTYWESACIEADYYPPQLYDFIEKEKAATAIGWNVEYTKMVIAYAMDIRQPDNRSYDWEFYQQELKNNSLSYIDDTKVCHVVHCYWKEFDGRVTHAIVEREYTTPANGALDDTQKGPKYLFLSVGRYASFKEAIHPMYMDRGNGGYHHSVTGLGVKMYGAMEYENRLLCNLMDKAFAPKILFRPTTAESRQKSEIAKMGDYGILPQGWEVEQTPIQGFLTDGLAMWRASSDLMRSNLSNYRQQTPVKETGNPATAREVSLRASEQSSLSKPTYSRYYKQLDLLYTEIVRRLCNLNSTDRRAQLFQERCIDRGVPVECFGRIKSVKAVRVIGQGSPFMRQQAVTSLAAVAQRFPEEGQQRWLNDFVASTAGQSAVQRYNPMDKVNRLPSQQHVEAVQCVGLMKIGIPAPVAESQNPVIFATTYLKAASQALSTLPQGGNPMEVLKFLEVVGPTIAAQLKRFATDPLREQAFNVLNQQWKELARVTDQLKAQVQKVMQKQQQLQQKAGQVQSDAQVKAMKVKGDLALKKQKQDATLAMQSEKHQAHLQQQDATTRQGMTLADANTASEINRKNRLAMLKE